MHYMHNAARKEERRLNMRWIGSIKEAIGMNLQELSRAVQERTLDITHS